MWAFLHTFGIDDTSGKWYAFWSGAGADLGELAIVGALIGVYRRHACHEPRCWRIGRVTVGDRGTLSCWHHHPEGRPQRGHVRRQYHLYAGGRPGRG